MSDDLNELDGIYGRLGQKLDAAGREAINEVRALVGWRSFETAPKEDGVPILMWIINDGDGYPVIASWFADGALWEGWRDDGNPCDQPLNPPDDTLWMPIRRPNR